MWLSKQRIFSDQEVENNFVYTPMAVNLTTPDIAFLAVPDRIQLGFVSESANRLDLIKQIMGGIVKALPHTPFHAVGFNFTWILLASNQDEFQKTHKKLFLSANNPLGRFFDDEDCRFGFYASRELDIGRLRLDIKPVIYNPPTAGGEIKEGAAREGLQLTFNVHRDISGDNKAESILKFLDGWASSLSIAEQMTEQAGIGWSN